MDCHAQASVFCSWREEAKRAFPWGRSFEFKGCFSGVQAPKRKFKGPFSRYVVQSTTLREKPQNSGFSGVLTSAKLSLAERVEQLFPRAGLLFVRGRPIHFQGQKICPGAIYIYAEKA